ncbi:guanylate kinase [Geothermobacter hydrogeniphilus]|uniref:Guanylate kinase n=1 Tax=Geothermobacter hydrogeniphilus TaxID=1969733 RepID=A0A1X0Y1R6_9BACT|nr:guanylate kinase [Geothermobacter hydrogeniphilus]ORJ59028.1 guanylate kinase [Geothermobacter hydrogeniphilus]
MNEKSAAERLQPIEAPREGLLIVVSAPSGAGKTTLCRHLVDNFSNIRQSVSFTTRKPRGSERDGVDYHFVDQAEFDRMVAAGEFAEWAEVHGNCYGTALKTLDESRRRGEDILLDIDCQGAAQLRDRLDAAVFVFILPPSLAELERRLRSRQTDSDEVIRHRLRNAEQEIRAARWYDYLVVNADLEAARLQLASIVRAERCRTRRFKSAPAVWFGLEK